VALEFAHLRFLCVAREDLVFPPFSGSTLRGVFGHALRELECQAARESCRGCPWQERCRYSLIFETPLPPGDHYLGMEHSPHPFVIHPPGNGYRRVLRRTTFPFELILVKPALDLLPTITAAWRRAGEMGIGPRRVPFEVVRVEDVVSSRVLNRGEQLVQSPRRVTLTGGERLPTPAVVLAETRTPLRILVHGDLVERPDKEVLFRAALRRLELLNHFYGDGREPLFQPEVVLRHLEQVEYHCTTRVRRFCRTSTRRRARISLDGVLGTFLFRNLTPELYRLLRYAEVFNVGKSAALGMGRIKIKPVNNYTSFD
jgi:CRISPR/Cas system endoribonuclease Cas6 (RAMP superfamily)